jgi:hypothetical protein
MYWVQLMPDPTPASCLGLLVNPRLFYYGNILVLIDIHGLDSLQLVLASYRGDDRDDHPLQQWKLTMIWDDLQNQLFILESKSFLEDFLRALPTYVSTQSQAASYAGVCGSVCCTTASGSLNTLS